MLGKHTEIYRPKPFPLMLLNPPTPQLRLTQTPQTLTINTFAPIFSNSLLTTQLPKSYLNLRLTKQNLENQIQQAFHTWAVSINTNPYQGLKQFSLVKQTFL
ncbi:alr1571 [Nostoc sp. PCC 7120 = FACHB-418]|nr:alr1571 [Nostoc sp. PCC 7120 = FACHB-418]